MISVFINSLTSGGAEKVVLTLIERFKFADDPLELIMIEKTRFYDLPKDIPSKYLTNYESLESGPLKIPYLFICAWRLKKSIQQPGQIIQSHLLRASFINAIAKLMGSKHHAQIVIHSRINFDHQPAYKRIISSWIYKKLFKQADSIVSICEVMKNDLDDYLDLKNHPKHIAIHNPHNLKEIASKAQEATPAFHFSSDKKYIISVGRLVDGKRIDDLIKALAFIEKQHKNTELIILGDGVLKNNLVKLSQQLNIEPKVHFLGFQQNPFAYIAKSDLLVLTSEWEGLPNIIIESMACGTAVISSDCISGPREIIHPESDLNFQLKERLEIGSNGILYPVGNIDLLAKGLDMMLSNDTLRENFVLRGLQRAKDFDEAKIAKKYLETFIDQTPDEQ